MVVNNVHLVNISRATREEAPLLAGLPPEPLFEQAWADGKGTS